MEEKQLSEKLTLLDQLQSACTHCGICSEACSTFQSSGWEHESPRGRLQLAARFLDGQIQLQSDALSTFDRCLGCRACEALCPHNVQYHQVRQIVQDIRRDLKLSSSSSLNKTDYQQWIKYAYRLSNIYWRHYGATWLKVPHTQIKSGGAFSKTCKSVKRGQPILAICCAEDLFQHEVIEQALAFAKRLGEDLQVDRKQPCCGALFERLVGGGGEGIAYPKEREKAVLLQSKARTAFIKWMRPQTYFLSKGCQCFIADQGGTQVQATGFYEWIENLLNQKKITLSLPEPCVVYYQPYCRSGKNEQDAIWRIMQRIQGLKVQEIAHPVACCGGYCGETFLHRENAQQMAKEKMSHLPSQAKLVLTSPDCWGLFKEFSEKGDLNLCYPIEVLMKAQLKFNTF